VVAGASPAEGGMGPRRIRVARRSTAQRRLRRSRRLPVMHGSARPRRRRAIARVRGTRRGGAALLRDQRLPSIQAFERQSRAGPVDIWLLAGEAEHGIVR
jgi:hypothetical protein